MSKAEPINRNLAFPIGPIRPPSESLSLLLQVTQGCTWNQCKFCQLYRNTPFRAYPLEEIRRSIDTMKRISDRVEELQNQEPDFGRRSMIEYIRTLTKEEQSSFYMVYQWILNGKKTVFLQDGNTAALKPERLAEIIQYLKDTFPSIERITTYGRADSLARISQEQFGLLQKAGLTRIHSGFESGSDQVLTVLGKGGSAQREIEAGQKIMAAGIELSVYFMPGAGGAELTETNAIETARVISAIDPSYVRIRTTVAKAGTDLWSEVEQGNFQLCDEDQMVREIDLLLAGMADCTGFLASDHRINLLPEIQGKLNGEIHQMRAIIAQYFSLEPRERRIFQLARRTNYIQYLDQLNQLGPDERRELGTVVDRNPDPRFWTLLLNRYQQNYI